MTLKEQEEFIIDMYADLFHDADATKVPKYCSKDFVEENNYDVLDYDAMVAHVEEIGTRSAQGIFDIEFIVNVPGQVVIRTIVTVTDQIEGAPPVSLLISYWQFNDEGKVNYCKEVEYAT